MKLAPKSFLYKMLRKKNIVLNGKKAEGDEILKESDSVRLFLSDDTIEKFRRKVSVYMEKEGNELNIIYENEHIIFINKPAGVLSQKSKKEDVSLVDHLEMYLNRKGSYVPDAEHGFSPGLCNRLDRNTSGILAAGRTWKGLRMMSELLREHKVRRYYLCIVSGKMEKEITLKGYLHKEERHNKVSVFSGNMGEDKPIDTKEIITKIEPIGFHCGYSMIRAELITGKSHQIRAHLSSIGHPIIGDYKYGRTSVNQAVKNEFGIRSQMLHSYEMVFDEVPPLLKDLQYQTFRAPYPAVFDTVMGKEKEQ
jgi:23S rRNA pseudouridine955/2504/2580 synthase